MHLTPPPFLSSWFSAKHKLYRSPKYKFSVCLCKRGAEGGGGGFGGVDRGNWSTDLTTFWHKMRNLCWWAQLCCFCFFSSSVFFFFFFPFLSLTPFPSTPTLSPHLPSLPLSSFPLLLTIPLSRSLTVQPDPSTHHHLKWTQLGESIAFWLSGTEAFQRSLRVYCMCACVLRPQPPLRLPVLQL